MIWMDTYFNINMSLAITVPVNETNTVWTRKNQQLPRKSPGNFVKNDVPI